jgi:small subunit ribosomal protein S17
MEKRNERKLREGVVVSTKMDKTAVVRVDILKKHPKYHKTIITSKKFHVHDEKSEMEEKDRVLIMETRPLSKTKRWRLVKVLEKAPVK